MDTTYRFPGHSTVTLTGKLMWCNATGTAKRVRIDSARTMEDVLAARPTTPKCTGCGMEGQR